MSWKWIWYDKQKFISITDHLYEVWYDLSLLCKEDSSTSTKSPPLLYSLRYVVSSPPISGSGPRDRIDSNRGIWKSIHLLLNYIAKFCHYTYTYQKKKNLHLFKWWNEIQYVHTYIHRYYKYTLAYPSIYTTYLESTRIHIRMYLLYVCIQAIHRFHRKCCGE